MIGIIARRDHFFRFQYHGCYRLCYIYTIFRVIIRQIPQVSYVSLPSVKCPAGGHVGMVWGWFIPCLFVMTIASCVAELSSSMPYVILLNGLVRISHHSF